MSRRTILPLVALAFGTLAASADANGRTRVGPVVIT
jgi:hypothetical protein